MAAVIRPVVMRNLSLSIAEKYVLSAICDKFGLLRFREIQTKPVPKKSNSLGFFAILGVTLSGKFFLESDSWEETDDL